MNLLAIVDLVPSSDPPLLTPKKGNGTHCETATCGITRGKEEYVTIQKAILEEVKTCINH
jgi:hypothetical protein